MRNCFRSYVVFIVLCIGQLSQANSAQDVGEHLHLSQSQISFGDVSPTEIAVIAGIAIAGLLLLIWLIRRFIRRKKLSNARKQRYGTASFDGNESDSDHLTRPRPEKTVIVRTIVIGSEDDVDVRFDGEGVSAHHAELLVLRQVDSSPLMPLEPTYYLRDLTSSSGIKVLRGEDWTQFRADVVIDDEQLRIGEVETTAGEIDRRAIEANVSMRVADESA